MGGGGEGAVFVLFSNGPPQSVPIKQFPAPPVPTTPRIAQLQLSIHRRSDFGPIPAQLFSLEISCCATTKRRGTHESNRIHYSSIELPLIEFWRQFLCFFFQIIKLAAKFGRILLNAESKCNELVYFSTCSIYSMKCDTLADSSFLFALADCLSFVSAAESRKHV